MMRVEKPADFKQPLGFLMSLLPRPLRHVAPEREQELLEVTDDLTLRLLDKPLWRCHACPTAKLIEISSRTVESLWCFAYASFTFYTENVAGRQPRGEVLTVKGEESRQSLELLRWALDDTILHRGTSWPTTAVAPTAEPPPCSNHQVANHLALTASAYVLLHEIAHIRCFHSAAVDLLSQEREADIWAADWIFGNSHIDRAQLTKRAMGIVIALMFLVVVGVYTGDYAGQTHPRHFDRLWNTLDGRLQKNNDVWAFVSALLILHLTNAGLTHPQGPFDSFYEHVNACIDVLANTLR